MAIADLRAELAPLAAVIAETISATPARLGQPDDLITALTLHVAAYMGGIVPGPDDRAQRRDQVLAEAADHLDRIADQVEARVAAYYGPASGIGPGSADMVREAARSVRSLATAADAPLTAVTTP